MIAQAGPFILSSLEGSRIGLRCRRLDLRLGRAFGLRPGGARETDCWNWSRAARYFCAAFVYSPRLKSAPGFLAPEIGLAELGATARACRRCRVTGGLHLGSLALGLALEMLVQLIVELRSQRVRRIESQHLPECFRRFCGRSSREGRTGLGHGRVDFVERLARLALDLERFPRFADRWRGWCRLGSAQPL